MPDKCKSDVLFLPLVKPIPISQVAVVIPPRFGLHSQVIQMGDQCLGANLFNAAKFNQFLVNRLVWPIIGKVARVFRKSCEPTLWSVWPQQFLLTRRSLLRQGRPTGIWITDPASSAPGAGFIRPPVAMAGLESSVVSISLNIALHLKKQSCLVHVLLHVVVSLSAYTKSGQQDNNSSNYSLPFAFYCQTHRLGFQA